MGRELRGKEVRETIGQVAHTRDRHQHAQNARQEGQPENEVADQDDMESESYHHNVGPLSMQIEKHERLRLQLICRDRSHGVRASQDDQGGEKKEVVKSPHGGSREAEERCDESESPVHRLKQGIEESRHSDIARDRDEVGCESQPISRLVRQDVVRRSRSIAIYNQVAENGPGEEVRNTTQIQAASDSGLETRRRYCHPFRHLRISCTGLKVAWLDPSPRLCFHAFPPSLLNSFKFALIGSFLSCLT